VNHRSTKRPVELKDVPYGIHEKFRVLIGVPSRSDGGKTTLLGPLVVCLGMPDVGLNAPKVTSELGYLLTQVLIKAQAVDDRGRRFIVHTSGPMGLRGLLRPIKEIFT
jgi:hypothetical protein